MKISTHYNRPGVEIVHSHGRPISFSASRGMVVVRNLEGRISYITPEQAIELAAGIAAAADEAVERTPEIVAD